MTFRQVGESGDGGGGGVGAEEALGPIEVREPKEAVTGKRVVVRWGLERDLPWPTRVCILRSPWSAAPKGQVMSHWRNFRQS